jgi:aromatic acid exporter family member 1
MWTRLPDRLRDPVVWADAAQLVKTALAAVIAWVVAVYVFDMSQAFLAPWAALLTVHATVFGTVRRGVQQVATSVLGVLIAFAAGGLFGIGAIAVGMVTFAGLLAGRLRGLRDQTTTAAATALVVLTAGYADDGGMLLSRLLDTAIGIGVGLLVNLVVWPPLRDRAAAHRIDVIDDRIGDLLRQIADELRRGAANVDDWVARTNELDDDVDAARDELGQAHESGRLNPRRAVPTRMRATEAFGAILTRLEQAVAESRSMALTIGLGGIAPDAWPPGFRAAWLHLLGRTGDAVRDADVEAIKAVRADLDGYARALDVRELPDGRWPIVGALLVNLRNILEALDAVADAQPVRVPAPASRLQRQRRPVASTNPPR